MANAVITLPLISTDTNKKFTGRGYKIKNLSGQSITVQTAPGNTIRYRNNAVVNSLPIATGAYAEVVCTQNDTNWDLLFISERDYSSTITMVDFKLPKYRYTFDSNSAKSYNVGNNWFMKSYDKDYLFYANYDAQFRKFVLTFEYQGLPFDITRMAVVGSLESSYGLSLSYSLRLSANKKNILEISGIIHPETHDSSTDGYPVRVLFINAN